MAVYLDHSKYSDTIYALATPPGRSAVAVIRLSGAATDEILRRLTLRNPPPPRRAVIAPLTDPSSTEVLDEALVLRFVGPNSYTGEDSAELHLHGSPIIVRAVSSALDSLGVRPAEAGEFTYRAFQNGRLDLAQAEGVSALIGAQDDASRRVALRVLDGEIGRAAARWREALLEAIALVEASIDFSDEDIEADTISLASVKLDRLAAEWRAEIARGASDQDHEVFSIAVLGPPNAGKSSFLNAVARRDLAIVSDRPGTTRDTVRLRAREGGFEYELIDTAGLRQASDEIELEGIERARRASAQADRRIFLLSPDTDGVDDTLSSLHQPGDLVLLNKRDLGISAGAPPIPVDARVSVHEGTALTEFRRRLTEWRSSAGSVASPFGTSARVQGVLGRAKEHLALANDALHLLSPETAIERLKGALGELATIADPLETEEVLGAIFSKFCIGK